MKRMLLLTAAVLALAGCGTDDDPSYVCMTDCPHFCPDGIKGQQCRIEYKKQQAEHADARGATYNVVYYPNGGYYNGTFYPHGTFYATTTTTTTRYPDADGDTTSVYTTEQQPAPYYPHSAGELNEPNGGYYYGNGYPN